MSSAAACGGDRRQQQASLSCLTVEPWATFPACSPPLSVACATRCLLSRPVGSDAKHTPSGVQSGAARLNSQCIVTFTLPGTPLVLTRTTAFCFVAFPQGAFCTQPCALAGTFVWTQQNAHRSFPCRQPCSQIINAHRKVFVSLAGGTTVSPSLPMYRPSHQGSSPLI